MGKKEIRRTQLLQILESTEQPISGTILAEQFNVTRQIIVGDMAALRSQRYPIVSTARGYQLLQNVKSMVKQEIVCKHDASEVSLELSTIVKLGGIVHDVTIEHDVYGSIRVSLYLRSLQDVENYLIKQKESYSGLLSSLSAGIHMHTIEADSIETMEMIIKKLEELGIIYH